MWVYANVLLSSQINTSWKGLKSLTLDGTDIIGSQHYIYKFRECTQTLQQAR